jgi:ligand-binding sensor domain-containing protein
LILPHNAGKLVGTPQGIYWQNGSASAWVKLQGSISKRIIYSLALDSDHPIVYAGTDQGIYRTSLDSMNFQIPSGNRFRPKAWCITAPLNSGENIYAGTSLGLMRSWDRGATWKIISASGMPDRVVIDAVAVSPSNKEHLFAGTSAGLFESMDGGVCWRRADNGKIGENISSVVFLDGSGNYILAANKSSGGVYYSRDGGNAWQNILASEFESPAYCIASNPNNPFHVYIGTQWDGIYSLFLR